MMLKETETKNIDFFVTFIIVFILIGVVDPLGPPF